MTFQSSRTSARITSISRACDTLKTLAEVKAVVCRVTQPDGVCVVNADDDLVMGATECSRPPSPHLSPGRTIRWSSSILQEGGIASSEPLQRSNPRTPRR